MKQLKFPYNCIGKITVENKNGQEQWGTGCLIASSLVLTSAHTFKGLSASYQAK
jgi:V8-like Glu-specific endopeptidase